MELLAKTVYGLRPMAVFAEVFVFDAWLGSECAGAGFKELLKYFYFYFLPTVIVQS